MSLFKLLIYRFPTDQELPTVLAPLGRHLSFAADTSYCLKL